jgi:hypothetical protein
MYFKCSHVHTNKHFVRNFWEYEFSLQESSDLTLKIRTADEQLFK